MASPMPDPVAIAKRPAPAKIAGRYPLRGEKFARNNALTPARRVERRLR